jgi:hypothetical protein
MPYLEFGQVMRLVGSPLASLYRAVFRTLPLTHWQGITMKTLLPHRRQCLWALHICVSNVVAGAARPASTRRSTVQCSFRRQYDGLLLTTIAVPRVIILVRFPHYP